MKYWYTFLATVLFSCFSLMPQSVSAQAGSITLKDGSGNVVGTYATVQSAYNAIPAQLTQAYRIEVDLSYSGTSEQYPIVFTQKSGATQANTITICLNPSAAIQGANFIGHTDSSSLFVLDGADWIVFDGYRPPRFLQAMSFMVSKVVPYPGGGSTSIPFHEVYPVISFINGAKHNTISYCDFANDNSDSGYHSEAAILFGNTNTGEGNDSNTIANCTVGTSLDAIASRGSVAYPNKGLTIRNNAIKAPGKGVEVGAGTSSIHIESNGFNVSNVAIVFYQLSDSNSVNGNGFNYDTRDSDITAIQLSPAINTSLSGHCLIANNMFNYTDHYASSGNPKSPVTISLSNTSPYSLTGIDLSGAGPVHATITHNTARFSHAGFQASATTHQASSVLLRYNNTNAGTAVQALNNLWLNDLTFGSAGSQHLALQLTGTAGFSTDYNTYGKGARVKIGSTVYASYPAYRNANSGLDLHSNDSTFLFEDINWFQLSARMYQLPALQGTPLALVPNDAFSKPHTYPSRGAIEITDDCSNGAFSAQIGTNSSPCAGITTLLSYFSPDGNTGLIHEWQTRSPDSLVFRDIPGAYGTRLLINLTVPMVYRVKDSCVGGSGAVAYSNNLQVNVRPSGGIGILSETHNYFDYAFNVSSYTTPTLEWNFGDGTLVTYPADAIVSHHYNSSGFYTVYARSSDGCDDSVAMLFFWVSPLGIKGLQQQGINVYPNPATTFLSISGAAKGTATIYSMIGQQLVSISIAANQQDISIADLPAGPYLLHIRTAEGVAGTSHFLKL